MSQLSKVRAAAGRIGGLTRVKALTLLPDNIHATTEMVARFYEVDTETIKKLVQRNREELSENDLRILRGSELRDFEGDSLSLSKVRNLALFTRRTILNVGQLLTGSPVAERVRRYLLDVEEIAPSELPNGTLRETRAWTQHHRPLFDAVWDRWYAADYDPPAALIA